MNSRREVPMYAQYNCVHLSKRQFTHIFKKGYKGNPIMKNYQESVRVTQTRDGAYWAEWKGDTVFWASRWYQVPKIVGERAQKIQEFVDTL